MKYDNLLRYAVRVVEAYAGEKPLHIWFKEFFRANPQMGSRDRKLVSEMVYGYYRLGHALQNIAVPDRILAGLLLCQDKPMELMGHLKPEWNEAMTEPLDSKIRLLQAKHPDFAMEKIFPWLNLLSAGIDPDAFCRSFLKKPDFFIRVRAGKELLVSEKLSRAAAPAKRLEATKTLPFTAYAFPTGTRLEEILDLNRDAVVQDLSSQKTGALMKWPGFDSEKIIHAWDACAASGGKSILLADLYPTLDLTVTDIRKSILENLRIRFAQAGLTRYQAFEIDLTGEKKVPGGDFDLVLADLPCTGSGTWSRTPESICYFDPQTIEKYRRRQEKMLSKIIRQLRPGGLLVYITCSVFAAENEELLEAVLGGQPFQKTGQEMIAGYRDRADSLFAAAFIKNI